MKDAVWFLRISRPGVRVPSIAPRKTRTRLCSGFSFCQHDGRGSNRAAAHSAASKATVRLCLACGSQRLGMSTVEAVNRKSSWLFLFFWQSLHTFAHLLHTLQKSHELFASLAQRVFRCTKKNLLREEHPRQLAALLCVHLPDGFKDHFTRDFCCHRRFVFRGFLRLRTCHILRVEVGFDLLG